MIALDADVDVAEGVCAIVVVDGAVLDVVVVVVEVDVVVVDVDVVEVGGTPCLWRTVFWCATELQNSVAHSKPCATEIISVAHGLLVRHKRWFHL